MHENRVDSLKKLEEVTTTFRKDLSPQKIEQDGVDEADLFEGVIRALYSTINPTQMGKLTGLVQDYFTEVGGVEPAPPQTLK